MSRTRQRPVAVVAAMKEEFEAILSRAHEASAREAFVEARIGSTRVALCRTGDGDANASRAAAALCEAVHPTALLGAGVAGALSTDLGVGDLVVSRRVRDSQADVAPPDAGLLAKALEATGAMAGTFLSVGRPLVAAEHKIALGSSLDGAGPAAGDMESAAWARAASSRGVPYLVVRSISERADEDLPEYLARCIGRDGGIRRSSVVLRALGRPGTIPALLEMRRRVRACAEDLADFLETFLSAGAPS